MTIGLLVLGILGLASVAAADGPSIGNGLIEARFEASEGDLTLVHSPSSTVFLTKGRFFAGRPSSVTRRAVADQTFGLGTGIDVRYPGGQAVTICLFEGLGLAVIRPSICNTAGEPVTIDSVRPFCGQVQMGRPVPRLCELGTGGLAAPGSSPGSYMWLSVVQPRSRAGLVAGWITCDRGSGVLSSGLDFGQVQIQAQIDYGRLRLQPGRSERLETLAVGFFEDARLGLEAWAEAVARYYQVRLPPQPVGYCSWYSRPYGGASDEVHIAQQAAFAAGHLARFGFSVIQIDDGWQAGLSKDGPRRNFTTHDPNGPYPSGMKAAADKIRSHGLRPGIWFMPFAGTSYDPFFADHQDWFVRRADDGRPYETRWGGTCLDMTCPGARQYLQSVVERMASQWGFTYLKIDGLWTGTATPLQYVNTSHKDDGMGDALFHDPNKTNIEAFREGLRLVRRAAGPHVFILGCNAPQNMRSYGGAFGLLDAMRIGPDNGPQWDRLLRGPRFGSRHYFLHGRIWYNDPDPVYVRDSIPLDHARLICSWVTLSGQLNMCSEWLPGLSEQRLDLLKRTMPGHGLLPRPVDLFENDPPRIWLLSDTRGPVRRDVVGLFNWSDDQMVIGERLDRIGLDPSATYLGFEYWTNRALGKITDRLELEVPARSCMVIALRKDTGHPIILSTSRHITQGIVDVLQEQWDPEGKELAGRSGVVGGDPYELRISGGRPLKASVSDDDVMAGVQIGLKDAGGLSRAVISSPVSRIVRWKLSF